MVSIIALDNKENFIRFLDPTRCDIHETHKKGGLRSLDFKYTFQDLQKDKELFKLGNKIWISQDTNIRDCLYVCNTSVKEDIFKDNCLTVELEEVLVELNNTPLVYHTELTTDNGFKTKTTNGQFVVKVDYNALNYFFGDYFNMGVIQNCLSDVASWIGFTGSMTRMGLLRKIEEETGNVFVTRYEKDELDNTVHRYLDFLNPINSNKNWTLNLEYDFQDTTSLTPIVPDLNSSVGRWTFTTPEDIPEVYEAGQEDWYVKGTKDNTWEYNPKDNEFTDENTVIEYTPLVDLDPANVDIRICDWNGTLLDTDGLPYTTPATQTPLKWTASDIGFTTGTQNAVISLCMTKQTIGMTVNGKTYPSITGVGVEPKGYVSYSITSTIPGYTESIADQITSGNKRTDATLLDDCYLVIYDNVNNKTLFRTCINRQIGHVHEEILDLTHNISNIELKIDETDTITAVSPIFEKNDNYTREQQTQIMTWWKNRGVTKGEIIPMIIERIQINATSQSEADASFGEWATDNYFWWPLKDQNQLDPSNPENNKYGFWRATAYWKAPFNKKKGENFIALDTTEGIEYTTIIGRNDTRTDKGPVTSYKMGTSKTTDETDYQIYNQLALYLKEHMTPKVEVTVDVANLNSDGTYNNYDVYDKVYIKIPDYEGLITATIEETTKEPHNPSKNTVKLSNYSINTVKTIPCETLINADNQSFEYPNTKLLTATFENRDYDEDDSYSIQYPSNKLLSFAIYKIENNSSSWTGETFTKTTNNNGEATIVMDYDPGDYEIRIQFGGDEEYLETSMTIKVNVGGKKEETTSTNEDGSTSTTTYYDKWGRSPDKKKIMAIGRISAPGDTGSYSKFWEGEFKNVCPYCHKSTLYWGIYYGGDEHTNWGWFEPLHKRAPGAIEGHIFCANCDMDFSVQGNEHRTGSLQHFMTKTKQIKESTKARAYLLKNGKMPYQTVTTSNGNKSVTNSTIRKVVGSVDAYVKKQALNIVGNKTGQAAAQAIASWMDKNIWYSYYPNFVNSAKNCLQNKRANCCDGTRLFFEMCDAAGLTEYYKMEYIHVYNHVYGKLTAKSSGNSVTVDTASDSHAAWGYICQGYRTAVLRKTTYPTRPF